MDHVTIGWRWLERTLNQLIDEHNKQRPLPSSTIAVEESPHGTLLKVVGTPQSQDKNQSQGTGSQVKHLLATNLIWIGVKWQNVTLIDPANNCAQSTLRVLVNTGNSNDSISIGPFKYPFWVEPTAPAGLQPLGNPGHVQ
jgi:hypothetical protein